MMNKIRKRNESQQKENVKKNPCTYKKHKNERENNRDDCSDTLKAICSSSSKENIELSLEVEIADSLQKLLSSPENCKSRLLDVTIIRPSKDNNVKCIETNTVAFDKDDIKDLLTIIEKQNSEENETLKRNKSCRHATSANSKPKYEFKASKKHESLPATKRNMYVRSAPSNSISGNRGNSKKEIPSYLRNVEARLIEVCNQNNVDDNSFSQFEESHSSSDSNIVVDKTMGDGSNAHHIYATAQTFDTIRKKLTCQNKNRRDDEKPDAPCLCQNCGTLGVLIESQKGPILSNVNPPLWSSGAKQNENKTQNSPQHHHHRNSCHQHAHQRPSSPRRGRYVDLRTNKLVDPTNLHQIKLRLNSLEERITHQEEQAINKEYFKKIIAKLITYCHSKNDQHQISNDNNEVKECNNMKDNSVQCSIHDYFQNRMKERNIQKHSPQSYCLNSIVLQQDTDDEQTNDARKSQSKVAGVNKSMIMNKTLESFCKWGEEIIKPGFDLKSKIMSLLDEKLNTVVATGANETVNNNEKEKKCKCQMGNKDKKPCGHCAKRCLKKEVSLDTPSTSTVSNDFIESESSKDMGNKCQKKIVPVKMKKSQYEPVFMRHHDKCGKGYKPTKIPLHIAYVSPCVKTWGNESATSIAKIKVKDNGTQISSTQNQQEHQQQQQQSNRLNVQDSLQEKLNCLKELAKSKNVDEGQLWRNIWNRVKDHARTKYDTVTIQIPTEALYKMKKGGREIQEIELTIMDLFDIVVQSTENSITTVNTNTVKDNRKRLEEIHKQLGIILNKQLTKN